MNFSYEKIRTISSSLVLIFVLSVIFCYGSNADASLMDEAESVSYMNVSGHQDKAMGHHERSNGDVSILCHANQSEASNKNSTFSTGVKTKVVSFVATVDDYGNFSNSFNQNISDFSSSPPIAERLSSVVKKE